MNITLQKTRSRSKAYAPKNICWFMLLAIASACTSSPESNPSVAGIEHIIIIGVDGMSPDGVLHAESPNMHYFMEHGSHTMHARAVLPTTSSTNWATMIMGVGPEQHGITSNEWERDDFTLPTVVAGEEGISPTIFSVVRKAKPDAEIAVIYDWDGFGRLFEHSAVNYAIDADGEEDAANKAVAYIKAKKPVLTFVHMDHVDHAGHTYGHGTPQYYKAVSRADSLLGKIIDASKLAGTYAQTLFIVTADHGGIGKGHGGETLAEIEIPFILYGKSVKKNHEIKYPVFQYDNAATVAFALHVEPPHFWIGKPVKSAFEGFPDEVAKVKQEELRAPIILPAAKLNNPAGGLFIDKKPVVEIQPGQPDDTIRYTLDGSDPSRTSSLYNGPFSLEHSAVLKAKSFSQAKESAIAKGYFRLVDSHRPQGTRYSYYEGSDWHKLPAFEKIHALSSGKLYEFRVDSIRHRDTQFAVKFESHLKINTPGEYTFYTASDDGSKLYINHQEVVDNDGGHGTLERSGKVTLPVGLHPITVTYFNEGGGSWIDVFYKGPGITKQIIPADVLYLN
ncbi:beta-glucosidase [Chryseolinea soli]|uniref:Beta-glucosidase n=2 Tax=Chryseolinea soli TaxID=2321403 RepID=A0A385SSF1_9BACT|nr:beta-glucosidase [Chryseolinea soli]